MSRRTVYHNSRTSTPTPQILQPNPYHGSTLSSSSANHRSISPFQRPVSSSSPSYNSDNVPERYTESPFGGVGVGNGRVAVDRTAHQLEGQNDDRLEGLLGKVKILKDITVGIGDEVRQSNMELGNMNDTFSSTSVFLSGTFKRMTSMAKRQGGHWCWFMMFLLIVGWIFMVVWFIRR